MKRMDHTLNNPLISIIVPVYNVEKYMEMSVKSIMNQTYSNLEIILVDDGSTDGSGDLCDAFAKMDDRVTVIHQENRGLGAARNVGIDHMNGDYLMFIDSDDELETNAIEILFTELLMNHTLLAVCPLSPSYKQGMPSKQGADIKKASIENLSGMEYLLKYQCASACCILYDRRAFSKFRFAEGVLCEDTHLMPRILVRYQKIVFIGNIRLYFYLRREASILSNFKKASLYPDMAMVTYENIKYFHQCYGKKSEISQKMMGFQIEQCLRKFADSRKCDASFVKLYRKIIEKYGFDIYDNKEISQELKDAAFAVAQNPEDALGRLRWPEVFEACEYLRRNPEGNITEHLKHPTNNTSVRQESKDAIMDADDTSRAVEALNAKIDKFKNYYNMLNQWLKLVYEEKVISSWFTDHNITTIAIYGMGEMGNRLYDALRDSNIKVSYAIDKAAGYTYSEVRVYEIGDQLPEVDAIVVTATFAFHSIREKLSDKVTCPVINLEEIVYGIG